VDAKHSLLAKEFDEKMNNPVRNELERQPAKKRQNVFSNGIFEIFTTKVPYKKEDAQYK
jgi:hypothetical protein